MCRFGKLLIVSYITNKKKNNKIVKKYMIDMYSTIVMKESK